MVPKPKDITQLIPVAYNKSYEDVCGDVTRLIIRETRDISILRLCVLQKNRTFACDWPTTEWSSSIRHRFRLPWERYEFVLEHPPRRSEIQPIEWFDIENPMEEIHSLTLSGNRDMPSTLSKPVAGRPLVLYGKEWGVLGPRTDIGRRTTVRGEGSSGTEPMLGNRVKMGYRREPRVSSCEAWLRTEPEPEPLVRSPHECVLGVSWVWE